PAIRESRSARVVSVETTNGSLSWGCLISNPSNHENEGSGHQRGKASWRLPLRLHSQVNPHAAVKTAHPRTSQRAGRGSGDEQPARTDLAYNYLFQKICASARARGRDASGRSLLRKQRG